MRTITDVHGYVGNFTTKVKSASMTKEIHHGIAIIATGAEEYKPIEYLYGEDDRVMTSLELEERIAKGDEKVANAESLVMIQCVGCRNEERNYCSRICCSHSIKNASEAEGEKPGDGYPRALPGYENVRVQRGLLSGSGRARVSGSSGTSRRINLR